MRKATELTLQADEPAIKGLERIALHLVKQALKRIEQPTSDRERDVHAVRTVIKRLRGLLRMIKPVMGDAAFRLEDGHLRNAARRLSSARDETIAREKLDKMRNALRQSAERSAASRALAAMKKPARGDGRLERVMKQVARDLGQTQGRMEDLGEHNEDWAALEDGLEATYRQARKRMKEALDTGNEEALHRWRIRVKNLYFELGYIEPVCPMEVGKLLRKLKKLQDLLGDEHDAAILRDLLLQRMDAAGGDETVNRVVKCLSEPQPRITEKCRELGEAIFNKKPRRFVRKLGKRWEQWKG